MNYFRSPDPLVRIVAILAAALTVGLGLCGLNFAVFTGFSLPIGGGSIPGHHTQENIAGLLIVTAMLEAGLIALSALGLLVALIALGIRALIRRRRNTSQEDKP